MIAGKDELKWESVKKSVSTTISIESEKRSVWTILRKHVSYELTKILNDFLTALLQARGKRSRNMRC